MTFRAFCSALPLFWLATIAPRQSAAAQSSSAATGVIGGRVIEAVTEAPVGSATVRVIGQDAVAQTDATGRFVLRGVRVGIVTIEVRRLGFAPVSQGDIAVSPAKPAEVLITVRPIDVQLDAITVRPDAFPAQLTRHSRVDAELQCGGGPTPAWRARRCVARNFRRSGRGRDERGAHRYHRARGCAL